MMVQNGKAKIYTEVGILEVSEGFMFSIPRMMKFSVEVDGPFVGWMCEMFSGSMELPSRGPIGANNLAEEKYFE